MGRTLSKMVLINFQLFLNKLFIKTFYHKVLKFDEQFKLELILNPTKT